MLVNVAYFIFNVLAKLFSFKENEEERRKQEMVAQIRRVATLEFTELASQRTTIATLENNVLRLGPVGTHNLCCTKNSKAIKFK